MSSTRRRAATSPIPSGRLATFVLVALGLAGSLGPTTGCQKAEPPPAGAAGGSAEGSASATRRLPGDGIVPTDQLARFLALPEPPLLVDVRTAAEHAGGHVPGALNVPVEELGRRVSELEAGRSRGVILFCESGRRAGNARGILARAGFEDLAVLDGSMERWRSENRPEASR